jgi:hypothetical protein
MTLCLNTGMGTVNRLTLMLLVLIALSVLCLGCGLYDPGFSFFGRCIRFLSSRLRDWHWGLRCLLSLDARVLFLGLKWTVCKVDRSSSYNAKVKNEWSCTSLSPTCPHGLHRDEFYFYHTELICSLTNVLKGMFLTVWSILTWHWQFL